MRYVPVNFSIQKKGRRSLKRKFFAIFKYKKVLYALFAVILFACCFYLEGRYLLTEAFYKNILKSPIYNVFTLKRISIEGINYLKEERVLKTLPIKQNDFIFKSSVTQIKDSLEKIDWIDAAFIKRTLPSNIFIKLTEKEPIALWYHNKNTKIVTKDGTVLLLDSLKHFKSLPVVYGSGAPEHAPFIIALLKKNQNILNRLSGIMRVRMRRWDVWIDDQAIQIKLPENNIKEAFERLNVLLKYPFIHASRVRIIDLRIPDQMVIRLNESIRGLS
ncbi:MAG: cell division protein FtsQ/DivIB [Alphaproteobacteria bacterium]